METYVPFSTCFVGNNNYLLFPSTYSYLCVITVLTSSAVAYVLNDSYIFVELTGSAGTANNCNTTSTEFIRGNYEPALHQENLHISYIIKLNFLL